MLGLFAALTKAVFVYMRICVFENLHIFVKVMVRGLRKQCSRMSDMQIHKYKYTNTTRQIHKYSLG